MLVPLQTKHFVEQNGAPSSISHATVCHGGTTATMSRGASASAAARVHRPEGVDDRAETVAKRDDGDGA